MVLGDAGIHPNETLGGGFKMFQIFLCSSLFGEMIHFD